MLSWRLSHHYPPQRRGKSDDEDRWARTRDAAREGLRRRRLQQCCNAVEAGRHTSGGAESAPQRSRRRGGAAGARTEDVFGRRRLKAGQEDERSSTLEFDASEDRSEAERGGCDRRNCYGALSVRRHPGDGAVWNSSATRCLLSCRYVVYTYSSSRCSLWIFVDICATASALWLACSKPAAVGLLLSVLIEQ